MNDEKAGIKLSSQKANEMQFFPYGQVAGIGEEPSHFVLVKNDYAPDRNDPLGQAAKYRVIGSGNSKEALEIAKRHVEQYGGVARLVRVNVEVRAAAEINPV